MAEAPVTKTPAQEAAEKRTAAITKMVDGGMDKAAAEKAYDLQVQLNQLRPRKERASVVPENETPEERFKRVATPRFRKVIAGIQSLAKMGTSEYESTPDQRDKIYTAIVSATNDMKRRLSREKTNSVDLEL